MAEDGKTPKVLQTFIYCHHCERIGAMIYQGESDAVRGSPATHDFKCKFCGEEIRIPWYRIGKRGERMEWAQT